MKNQPLTSNDHAKLLFFGFLMVPAVLLLVGIIPTIFLAFGVFMMKRSKSFSYIDTAVKYFKFYNYLVISILLLSSFWWLFELLFSRYGSSYYIEVALIFLFSALIPTAYIIAARFLFHMPLENHAEWVENNGIFSSEITSPHDSSKVSIIRGENLKQYSVADELIKWAKLKDDGHITVEEFNDARKKLLK